jgi:hypothetical protein
MKVCPSCQERYYEDNYFCFRLYFRRITWSVLFIGFAITIVIIFLTSCNKYVMTSEERVNYAKVNDILVNPEKYDGKLVQVGGWASSLRFINSRFGAYTYFLLGDQSGKTISFVGLGILPIKEGDFISVTVKYKKFADPIWIDSIEGPKTDRQQ